MATVKCDHIKIFPSHDFLLVSSDAKTSGPIIIETYQLFHFGQHCLTWGGGGGGGGELGQRPYPTTSKYHTETPIKSY